MIAILDYGIGNTGSLLAMCSKLCIPAMAARTPDDLLEASSFILPGVGHYDAGMTALRAAGLEAPLRDAVITGKRPLLGICLGMQMLADSSEEGIEPGLGFIPGRVKRFTLPAESSWKVPNMGWRDLVGVQQCALFPDEHIPQRFYFVHSYHFCPANSDDVIARADYGGIFTAVVNRENVWGTQFHPEKSHRYGMALIAAFANIPEN